MNDKINELYNKLDAQDEIIEQLELQNAQLRKDKQKAIEYINNKKKILNKHQIEGTNLQVGTFMWGVDELLDILKGSDKENENR